MCTALTTQNSAGDVYFGRTMDFSYPLDPEFYIVPKGYQWKNLLNTHRIKNQYSFMGIGQNLSPVTLADGVNEMGFAAAVLYFPGYALYDPPAPSGSRQIAVASTELVKFLLSQCASTDQAASLLRAVRITGVKDPVTEIIAPLHWIMADSSGKCMVIETTSEGLKIMENHIGVFSNSPDFPWHMANLRNYMNMSPSQHTEQNWGAFPLKPFGQGAGTFGLPGDFTPPARFVRTAYLKSHTPIPDNREQAVNTCFHLLEGVSIPKGAVVTDRGTSDYTQYTACISLTGKEYFFKTYDNSHIVSVKLPENCGPDIRLLGKLSKPVRFQEWK